MNRLEYSGMCELSADGRLTWVENKQTHEQGLVVGCGAEMIRVEFSDHCETWPRTECRELTHGYRVNYTEIEKHPHEFDSHLD